MKPKLIAAIALGVYAAWIAFALADDTVTVGGKNKFIQPSALVFINASGTPVLVSETHPLPIATYPTPTATASSTSTPTATATPTP